jgi:hypothetical protein
MLRAGPRGRAAATEKMLVQYRKSLSSINRWKDEIEELMPI